MAINVDTRVKTVAVDANIVTSIEQECTIQGGADRRLAAAFVTTSGSQSEVVLIFQKI